MKLNIIIPTYNEEQSLPALLKRLREAGASMENVLIVDGGSDDRTIEVARNGNVPVLKSSARSRAVQMNEGAAATHGDWLYFIHADTLPPISFYEDIAKAIKDEYLSGCFRMQFDSDSFLLKFNAFFTRFNRLWCRGGDQTLFVQRKLFNELGGFCQKLRIMEEYDLIEKLQERTTFKIIPKNVLASSRKYNENSWLRVQYANLIVFNMYKFGFDQDKMVNTYRRLLKLP